MSDLPSLTLGAWLRHDFIMSEIDRLTPSSVLEVGTGRGAMGARIAARLGSPRFVGVEPDDQSREVAAQRLERFGPVLDGFDAVDDDNVDMVVSFEVLEHIPDDLAALRQWAEKLQAGGSLLISVPAGAHRMGPSDEAVGHLRRYDKADLESLLGSAGFDVVQIRATGFPLGYLLDAVRNFVARRKLEADDTSDASDRTAASGRFMQFDLVGPLLAVVAAPFRVLQRPSSSRGTGWFVSAVKRA